jgi:hypothetical protein
LAKARAPARISTSIAFLSLEPFVRYYGHRDARLGDETETDSAEAAIGDYVR